MLCSKGNSKVPVEVIVILHEILNRVKIDEHFIELSEKEEAGGHALSSRDGVAFLSGGADYLEELMGKFEVSAVFEFLVLASDSMDYAFNDVIPWHKRF
jgi:hypothetical protein